jgi:hypothetical protein
MSTQVASRLRITGVKEPVNEPAPTTATARGALEHMGLTVTNTLNLWQWLEEHVDRCIPFLAQPF